jgi:hypothetical protein
MKIVAPHRQASHWQLIAELDDFKFNFPYK